MVWWYTFPTGRTVFGEVMPLCSFYEFYLFIFRIMFTSLWETKIKDYKQKYNNTIRWQLIKELNVF